MHTLFLVGTPIGNLEDLTLRALRVLGEVSLIAAEDTRTTGRLLKRHGISAPLVSYHEYSGPERIGRLIKELEQGDVALVSEAGMPGLSDPGYRLVQAAIEAGARISPIPGPSAVTAALVGSGLPTDSFLFLGFLPRRRKARRARLAGVATLPYTIVLFEAPHRLLATLDDLVAELGDRMICVGRELTKLYEELWRGQASQAIEHFSQGKIRGEITLVVAGAADQDERWSEEQVRAALRAELERNVPHKEAAATIAEHSGWSTRDLYALALDELNR